ncbi:hypothetical protein CGCTS75_v008120 [Colletotrichum tropicale]|nr:hypothetical protein CGCTS75_v008120 [Colletotrichum tropicale]
MKRPSAADVVADLRQREHAGTRTAAIATLGKALRRADSFLPLWTTVGGADGLAALMAEFSVKDVQVFCRWLGRTASAENFRAERRAGMGQLVRLLYDEAREDKRPLRVYYQDLIPACELEVVEEWEADGAEWTSFQQKALSRGHRERYEENFLARVFEVDEEERKLSADRTVFKGNMKLQEQVFEKIVDREGEAQIPRDFYQEFALPLLRRLVKKRADEATRDKFLDYVVSVARKYPDELGRYPNVVESFLLQHAIRDWKTAREERKEAMRAHVVHLLELYPAGKRAWEKQATLGTVQHIINTPKRMTPEARFELLRLALQHLHGYSIDIEDDSDSGIARLKNLPVEGDLWPVNVFFSIDTENARALFERLAKAYPSGDFFAPGAYRGKKSVCKQRRGPDDDRCGDVEIVRSLLIRKSKAGAEDTAWLDRVRRIVEDRKKAAQQSREPIHRAFWTKSAMNLCVAAGDLEMLADTVLWARRFNKDSLTVYHLYSSDVWVTVEVVALLGGVPEKDTPAAERAKLGSVKKDVDIANRILVDLTQTATMVVQEPGFDRSRWRSVLRLPKAVADFRLHKDNVESFENIAKADGSEDHTREITDILWKPTMDVLLEVEALLYSTTSTALLNSSNSVEVQAVYILNGIRDATPKLLAKLAKWLMDSMRERLGAKRLNAQMLNIVTIVLRVANSDQPALACPFIRNLIMDGGENSSWHRQLINVSFLRSLPAKAAKEFLFTMANAMRDKMREQNARPFVKEGDKAQTQHKPAIKVTTIKMMAQVLNNNRFIDAVSSCDILTSLLSEARHIDARITIVDSLISTMEVPSCPPELRQRVLDALEKYIVPAAAQLSERRPYSEEEWAAELPEAGEETPLMEILLAQTKNSKLSDEDRSRIAGLVVAALEGSAATNARWMELFLAKNGFSLDDGEKLPRCSVNPKVLSSMFRDCTLYMPVSLLTMLREMALVNIDPSPGITRVTEAVKKDRDLLNSNAGKHWLKHFNNPGFHASSLGLDIAAAVLQRPAVWMKSKLENGKGVDFKAVQEFVLAAANKFLQNERVEMVDALARRLCSERMSSPQHWESWRDNSVPVVNDIIASINDMRLSPGRAPTLPNVFRLKVEILPLPFSSARHAATFDDSVAYVIALSDLIEELGSRRGPYHEDFAYLKNDVVGARSKTGFALFAVELGRMHAAWASWEPTLAEYLRMEVVGELLLAAEDPKDEGVASDVLEMMGDWTGANEDEMRALGVVYEGKLKALGKKGWIAWDEQK